MQSEAIRQIFFDFFKSKEHVIVPSAPIVIKHDPTLMFTNAGMNQFKDYFLGNKKPAYTRVADTQKCLRVSGKHNDLEEVGVDTYHHTMFEMLGNWSFGNGEGNASPYFKKEAIAWAWELLTEVFKMDKDRLYVTVFKGDKKENLLKDEEAYNEWKKWIDEERILLGNKKDNFWEMGDSGPCGPSSEIHYDSRTDDERKKVDGKTLINNDDPQVIEIWNIVFIQYNRKKDGSLEPLPAKHVDTGMGFERLVRVLQNKQSNYDTDIFTGTIAAIEKITGKKYISDTSSLIKVNSNEIDLKSYGEDIQIAFLQTEIAKAAEIGLPKIVKTAVAFRVIADHIRAICFTIADGQLPSNTGAGYVIRRILRRAVRYYYSYLDYKFPLLHQLVFVIAGQFENVFPELNAQKDFITKVVKEEEEAFLRTLGVGLLKLNIYIQNKLMKLHNLKDEIKKIKEIDGKFAFELSDTYGFPLDLTKLIVAEYGFTVDEAGFEKEMQLQKNRSRAASFIDAEDWITINENGSSKFVGYENSKTESKVLKYRKTKSQGKQLYQIVLDVTPFYAESGGQVGDTGVLFFDEEKIPVVDTKKENDLIIHFIEKLPTNVETKVIAKIDLDKRKKTAIHHSATHLLHAALRQVLGNHVAQKGSLVNDEYLRFDFSHFAKLTDGEIKKIETIVNEKIRLCVPVIIQFLPKEEALKTGAMALFGEKYGDTVRVVTIDPDYSVELCGGTHVGNTGEIGFFKIIAETAVGAGIRRIEALSGKAAEDYVQKEFNLIHNIRQSLKNPKDIFKAIDNLINENGELKKQSERFETKQLALLKNDLLQQVETINGINFIGKVVDVFNVESLKKICFLLKNESDNYRMKNYVIVLASTIEGKPHVALMLDDTVAADKNLDASKIIKENIAPLIKGGGGGQKTLATAGGQDASKLSAVIEKVKSFL